MREDQTGREDRDGAIARVTFRRRTVLRAALAAVTLSAGGGLLAACGDTATTPAAGTGAPASGAGNPTATKPAATAATAPTATTGTSAAAPTTAAAVDGVIPSPAPGVPEAYLKLPPPFKSVAAIPGRGGKVTAAVMSYSTPVPPRSENTFWQELEKWLGVTYEPDLIPADAYPEKMATLIAGGTLPDLTVIEQLNAPGLLKTVNQGAFTDLTPYLIGDALKEFPNLAKLPEYGWRNVKIKNKIYGVPRVRFIPDQALFFRDDWAAKLGTPRPKNADEFLKVLQDMTKGDPDGNGAADTYGIASWGTFTFNQPFFRMMFRVPNGWRLNPDGTLTNAVETDEFKAAIAYIKRLWEAGVYHPDSPSLSVQKTKDGFAAGQYGAYMDGWTALTGQRAKLRERDPGMSATILIPPGHDGGQGVTYNSQGFFGFAAIPATVGKDKERVKELLRICDYLCAPFGSEEYNFLRYGLPGVHHEIKNGLPVTTDKGRAEMGALATVAQRTDTFFYPNYPEEAAVMQRLCAEQLAVGIDNPVVSLYSPTATAKAGELNQFGQDRLSAIILGREPFSALDQYVKEWRSRAGDQMRKEYEAALKEQ